MASLRDLCSEGGEIRSGAPGRMLKDFPAARTREYVITPASITARGLIDAGSVRRLGLRVRVAAPFRVEPGDVVCVRQGTLGRQAVVTRHEQGWLVSDSCIRIRLSPESPIRPDFLAYAMGLPQQRTWVLQQASGATVPAITIRRLENLTVPVPPLNVQQQIAELLSVIDRQSTRYEHALITLGDLRDSVMDGFLAGRIGK